MPTGTVKWFNEASGYGFVMPDEGGEEYELRDGGMGREAIHVAPLPAERDG